ncbi:MULTISPECIES: THUMP-like domain-containing protein [Tenacibaculum]|uniref:THUMP-like domain-containing protein n=1 Tax=Tenacibaculum TaxID=104267 RepID=UPI001F0B4F2E|nr:MULTISPECIES: RsmD family RNA methyltransferase [Tenacibaculum]MCH3882584.1 class I SAM-dependent methyltransferase [Tenacibaculum aquimarinum]MDO6600611.1 RsmD family RNA methyltransferase [Tenacibaculum sp. 1_MG-2023]
MDIHILHTDVQNFINDNLNSDITKLILKGSPFKGISIQKLSNQIVSKQKSKNKLPNWFTTENIFYPPKISIEQTSSEETARYKSSLVSGENLIDITGGFGVDCYYFSKTFKNVIHAEINVELSEIVTHNYKQLQIKNIQTIASDGFEFLEQSTQKFDCIYIDPSRRNDVKGKVFLLNDCLPNVPKNIDFLFTKTDTILLKNSPMLDITSGINELKFVKEIHVVALKNEVKEVLFLLEKGYTDSISIKTINLQKNSNQLFNFELYQNNDPEYSEPLTYLYEPNSAILKSGGFNQITSKLNVKKLHQHSHLYTSGKLEEFPGRVFKILTISSYDKKQLKKLQKANITVRNFPKTVAEIRKETKIKDGGEKYLFFTKDLNNKLIVIETTKNK